MAASRLVSSPTFERPIQGPTAFIEKIICDDVLNSIFCFVAGNDYTAFNISQVCGRWRTTALNDSTLWSCIVVDEKRINQSIHARQLVHNGLGSDRAEDVFPRVALMLRRSRKVPIDVVINIPLCGKGSLPFNYYHAELLAGLLQDHVERFRDFHLRCAGFWKYHSIILTVFIGQPLPYLADLAIDRSYSSVQDFYPHLDPPTFKEITCPLPFVIATEDIHDVDNDGYSILYPSLRRVLLTGTYSNWSLFAGSKLTHITITDLPFHSRPTVMHLREMLKLSDASLEYLRLSGSLPFIEPETPENLQPVVLKRLTSLILVYTMPVEVAVFADHFSVPNLKLLEVVNRDQRQPSELDFVEESQIYGDTLMAFMSILTNFPIDNLDVFTLSGAQFGSPPPFVPSEENALTGRVKLRELPVPFQLVQRLSSVRKLRLDNPDRFLLAGMLYPQLTKVPKRLSTPELDDWYDNMPRLPLVLSTVDELYMAVSIDETGHRSVMRYLNDRWGMHLEEVEERAEDYLDDHRLLSVLQLDFQCLSVMDALDVTWTPLAMADSPLVTIEHGTPYDPIVRVARCPRMEPVWEPLSSGTGGRPFVDASSGEEDSSDERSNESDQEETSDEDYEGESDGSDNDQESDSESDEHDLSDFSGEEAELELELEDVE